MALNYESAFGESASECKYSIRRRFFCKTVFTKKLKTLRCIRSFLSFLFADARRGWTRHLFSLIQFIVTFPAICNIGENLAENESVGMMIEG